MDESDQSDERHNPCASFLQVLFLIVLIENFDFTIINDRNIFVINIFQYIKKSVQLMSKSYVFSSHFYFLSTYMIRIFYYLLSFGSFFLRLFTVFFLQFLFILRKIQDNARYLSQNTAGCQANFKVVKSCLP